MIIIKYYDMVIMVIQNDEYENANKKKSVEVLNFHKLRPIRQ